MFNSITLNLKITTSSFLSLLFSLPFTFANANNISLDQITQDVTTLASDDMKGRANFSPQIKQAANYISKRFHNIGLIPFAQNKDYQQEFSVYHISPLSAQVVINGKVQANNDIAIATASERISWQSTKTKQEQSQATEQVNIEHVSAQDNLRDKLSALNQSGGQHIVLINRAHKKLFKRYQQHFVQGTTKLSLIGKHSLVMILTNEKSPQSYQVTAKNKITEKSLSNVIGVLPGSSQANEIIIYSAHYDHLGGELANKDNNTGTNKDTIYNGADDDASGTTAIINLAQYFATEKNNARTLVFVAFAAEEIGGFGSRYFSKQVNPKDIIAMVNIEMIGKPSKFGEGQVWMTGIERSNLAVLMNQQLSGGNNKVYADPYPEQKLFYRSDNATLARLGVPAHSFSSAQIDKDQHYHQVTDDIASLDLSSMQQVIKNLAVATTPLVTGEITPTRIDRHKVNTHGKIY